MRPLIASVQRALFNVLSRVCGSFDSEQEHRVRSLAWEGASEGKERERLQAARINNRRARARKNK